MCNKCFEFVDKSFEIVLISQTQYVIIILIMANKNSKAKSRNKFDQRRTSLVGVKRRPLPRDKRERQIQQLTLEMQHFSKTRKAVAHKARQKLGYDFDRDYMTNPNLTLGDIELKNEKHPQKISIPMDPELVERFIAAPKYVIKKFDTDFEGKNHMHHKTQYILMAALEEGPVLFEFYNHLKYPFGNFSEDNFNIGFLALLQGMDYFQISRYDSLSLQGHTQVFDDDGNIIMQFISSKNCKNMPHSHNYDIRYAVLFTGKRSLGHEDRKKEQKYSSYATAVRAWKKKFHVYELNHQFSDDMKIGQIYDILREREAKIQAKQHKNGGDLWNSTNSQKTSKDQSKQKE